MGKALREAAARSLSPGSNWRWMLASVGIGAGLGLVTGLLRLGDKPADLTPEVVATVGRVALFMLAVGWVAVVFFRAIRSLMRASRSGPERS